MRTLIIASLLLLMGCSGATTTEIRREPAKVRIIDIDTRPAPNACLIGGPTEMIHPVARALVLASLAVPPEEGVTVDPNGRVRVGKGVQARVTVSEAEGDRPEVTPPTGGKAKSTALDFIVNSTKVPKQGAPLILWGVGIMALGPAAWVFGAGKKIGLPIIVFGGVVFGAGWIIANAPWIVWLLLAGGAGILAYWVFVTRQGRDAVASVETTAPVVEESPKIILAELTALLPDVSGTVLAQAAERAASKIKGAIRAKAKANPKNDAKVERAVKRAKKATATATTFRGS